MMYRFVLESPDYGGYSMTSFDEFETDMDARRHACVILGQNYNANNVWVYKNVGTDSDYDWKCFFSIYI